MIQRLFRLLALLLAIVLPMRLMAAGIVPIVGMPGHAHQHAVHSAAAHAYAQHALAKAPRAPAALPADDGGHRACAAHAAAADAPADSLHEHGCPHLGMASMSAPVPLPVTTRAQPRVLSAPSARYVSVVLDVPSPPPTGRV